MHGVLTHASLARIPAAALTRLGRLRAYASVEVRLDDHQVWVRWDEAGFQILSALLPVHGAEFFERVGTRWHRCGSSLPAFRTPEDGYVSLASALTPARVHAVQNDAEPLAKLVFALQRSATPRSPRALLCKPGALANWAEMAMLAQFKGLEAVRSGDLVLVMATGDAGLPPLAHAERYWGERLLCPLGYRPDPDLPESALLPALGIRDDECGLVRHAAVEVIPRGAARPLSRASARLAADE